MAHKGTNISSDVQRIKANLKNSNAENKKDIIRLLTHRTVDQRQEVLKAYDVENMNLVEDLKAYFKDNEDVQKVITALLMTSSDLDAYSLNKATKGIGTDESALIEVLASRSNKEVHEINVIYKIKYKTTLEEDLKGDTSGNFESLLVALNKGKREHSRQIDINRAKADAQALYKAGEGKFFGTDEETFTVVMTSRDFNQLQQTFEEYKKIAQKDIVDSIKCEFSGNTQEGLIAIIELARNRPLYFATQIHEALTGLRKDKNKLIRIIVSEQRSEMQKIKTMYQHKYKTSLEEDILTETSGDFSRALQFLIQS